MGRTLRLQPSYSGKDIQKKILSAGLKAYENMPNSINHLGNANQNDNKIQFHINLNGYHKKS